MIELDPPYRRATPEDAAALAELVNFAGEGLPFYLWDKMAAAAGKSGLSIIVADGNSDARRLYERWGCRQVAQRPMVKEAWDNPGLNWVLLVKPLDGG